MKRSSLVALAAGAGLVGLVAVAAPAQAATYTRVMTCNSTGLPGYSVTSTVTWQERSDGLVDLVQMINRHYQGVSGRDWATSETAAHKWGSTNKAFKTYDPVQSVTVTFPDSFYASKSNSIAYLAASDNARGIKCSKTDNAL